MAVMKKVFHSDAGHGWLAVKMDELKMMGIESDISEHSYVKGKTVYLEEDCDAMKFINAAKGKGITVELKESPPRDNSPIRYFKSYSPELVD
ncbi:MAG: hypothetical protein HOM38_08890 [Euryarchaeota archaeon]|jgi:hypothetical protein|nr:hypothetical protein [Euryarchaeota archaeon]